MKEVYIVVVNWYHGFKEDGKPEFTDTRINGVFDSQEKAEAYIAEESKNAIKDGWSVEQYSKMSTLSKIGTTRYVMFWTKKEVK